MGYIPSQGKQHHEGHGLKGKPFLSKPTVMPLSFHCEFVSLTTASLTRRQDACTSGTSSAPTLTTCFFGTADTVAKPSHSSLLSRSATAPHLYRDIAEELYPWDTLPSPSDSHGKQELFFCEREIFLQHNEASQRFPSSTVRCLSSLYHTSHLRSILDCSFHRSHPTSPIPFHVSGFNARALCFSK